MPKYRVTCTKMVRDYLRAYVEVEAATAEEAEDKALEQAERQNLYQFWQCGDGDEPEAEAMEIKDAPAQG